MVKENIKKWVDALRSGDFIQGTSALEIKVDDETRHCCLGVACRIAMQNDVEISTVKMNEFTLFNEDKSHLPHAVRDWLGVESADPTITHWREPEQITAVDANDNYKYTFAKIADLLEEKYLKEE